MLQTEENHKKLSKIILSGLFLALSYIIPFITGQFPKIGSMLCPMHIPVLLCGFFCGWHWGLAVGFIAPIIRSLTLGIPHFLPTAICMSFELAAYGAVSGTMYKIFPPKKIYVYCSLLISMIIGRIIWGGAMFICMGMNGKLFTYEAFLAGAITNAIPGIIVQIIIIPILVIILDKFKNNTGDTYEAKL